MKKYVLKMIAIGVFCFGSSSGFVTTLCTGFDGRIAMETAALTHCHCAENGDVIPDGFQINLPGNHNHCVDTIITSSITIPVSKNNRAFSDVFFTPVLTTTTAIHRSLSELGSLVSRNHDLTSFHTPLRTIVLLA